MGQNPSTIKLIVTVIITVLVAALTGPAHAKARRGGGERPGPKVMIFDPAKPAESPQILIETLPPDAVPVTPRLIVTIGEQLSGERGTLSIDERSMIPDHGKAATPRTKSKRKPKD